MIINLNNINQRYKLDKLNKTNEKLFLIIFIYI